MLCMICKKNEATVHLTQIIEGKITKVDLCERCAKEKGVEDAAGFALADLLMELGTGKQPAKSQPHDVGCPVCGCTQSEFRKSGRLGCAKCYEHFWDILEPALKAMHRGTQHIGKIPKNVKIVENIQEKIQFLEQKLKEAVALENYEEAARLRDMIRQLKERAWIG